MDMDRGMGVKQEKAKPSAAVRNQSAEWGRWSISYALSSIIQSPAVSPCPNVLHLTRASLRLGKSGVWHLHCGITRPKKWDCSYGGRVPILVILSTLKNPMHLTLFVNGKFSSQ